ncbi:MAG: DUF1330 domain-containing protein [Ginsengibacter sp.]
MPAYVIVDVKINNHDEYEEYKKLTPAAIGAYQGSFIVRGGPTETLEGDWAPGRIVVLEFPDAERARQWWSSTEYAAAKLIRQGAAVTRMILVDGVNS